MKTRLGKTAGWAVAALLCAAPGLRASAAPSEDEGAMFGGSPAAVSAPAAAGGPAGAPAPGAEAGAIENSDSSGLSTRTLGHDDFANGTTKDDPLQIGGTVYQQWYVDEPENANWAKDGNQWSGPGQAAMSMPLQIDTFLDARPNDRLRGFVDARLIYDATKDANGNSTAPGATNYGDLVAGSSSAVSATAANPAVVLDQAWLNFDVDHKAFVTVGKQHVKWGTGHIWNPTDFLTQQKLNPLQPYDLRLGNTMVKVQVPVPGRTGTNLYAVGLLDNPEPASTLQQTGGAFRAETLLEGAEVGVDAVVRDGEYPAYGADLSGPVGPLDGYAEVALLSGDDFPDYVYKGFPAAGPPPTLASIYGINPINGPVVQAVAGASYDFPWKENRQATLGAEYFYNELGVDTAKLLPVLIYQGLYTPFYMGKDYASIYLSAEGPDEAKKTNFNLSNIANLSDGSFVSRLDFTWLALDYLTLGAWATAHYGTVGGELNFALNTPALSAPKIPAVNSPPVPVELGLSLRLGY